MNSISFHNPEVSTAYEAITHTQNNLYKTSAELSLENIDQLISFLKEQNGELTRELATYSKRQSLFYLDPSLEEKNDARPTLFSFRPIHIAYIILHHDAETKERRSLIKTHLTGLDHIIKQLSWNNKQLTTLILEKKAEIRAKSPTSRSQVSEDVEMRIIRPKKIAIPHYQQPLNRTPRTQIVQATVVSNCPSGIPLQNSLMDNSPLAQSSLFSSYPSTPFASPRNASEIHETTISFDKKA